MVQSPSVKMAAIARSLVSESDNRLPPTEVIGTRAVAAPFPQIGEDFVGFDLVAELGRGAMGRVYLARQRSLSDRTVVIKVGHHLSSECQKLAKLQHPNIVPVYSFHQAGPMQVVCMPYRGPLTLAHLVDRLRTTNLYTLDGKALTTVIDECRQGREPSVSISADTPSTPINEVPLAVESRPGDQAKNLFSGLRELNYVDAVLTIVRQVTDGLRLAHAERIVHSDLKPANVLISDDGCPQLIDFGIAYDGSNAAAHELRIGGTRPYMSPEQLNSLVSAQREYDERSDLYAVGVILHELLTGQLPFEPNFNPINAAVEMDWTNRFGKTSGARSFNARVPYAVDSIITKCLAPNVKNRYQNASQLLEDLDRQLSRRPLRHAPNPSTAELGVKWATRNRLSLVAAGLLAVAGVVIGGFKHRENLHLQQVMQLQAAAAGEQFAADQCEAEFYFGLAELGPSYKDRAWETAHRALDRYRAWDDEKWFDRSEFRALPADRLHGYREQAAALMLLLANSQAQQAARAPNDALRTEALAGAVEWNRRAELTHPTGDQCRAIWVQRSFLARLSGDRTEAERLKQLAESITPGAADSLLEGRQLLAEGRTLAARELLVLATKSDPQSFWAWFHLGVCRTLLGQDGAAAAAYDICASLEPGFFGTYFNRGQVRLRLGRYADAEADFADAIESRSDWADPYLLRALSREAQRNFSAAITDLNRALELGYTPTSIYLVRSRVHGRMMEKAASERDLAEGLKIVPTDERGWLARAQARLFSDPIAALGDYDKAIELNPRSLFALQGRAHLLSRAGKNKEALVALSKIIEINPDSADAWSGRGVMHARLNDRDSALADAREALRLTERPSTKYQVAGIYAMTSRTHPEDRREALALLDGALRAGFGFEYLDKDRELDPIRKDTEFLKTVQAARAYRNSLTKSD